MKIRGELRPVISFALVVFILLSILFPLLAGMRNALGIQEAWQGAKKQWHNALSASLRGSETGSESLASLTEILELDSFKTLIRFSPSLASCTDSLKARIHELSPPYSLKSIMEIEVMLDTFTEELNVLSAWQVSSFQSLLLVSYLLMALLLILYGGQSRQLAVARSERALAARLKEISTEIHETERKKIARDLHDGLSQNLALARMSVDGLPEGNVKKQLRLSLDCGFQELRRLLFDLRSLEDFSGPLDELVRRECGQIQERFGLEVTVHGGIPIRPSWNMDHFAQFFRILHEGLINILRHSGEGQAEVVLKHGPDHVELFIRDKGRGMGETNPGFGMQGMKERTALLGGTIEWNSPPGKGTEIHLSVPEVLT